MARDTGAAVGFFDRIHSPLGGDGRSVFAGGSQAARDEFGRGARPGGVLNCDNGCVCGNGVETVPYGVLSFGTASHEPEWLSETMTRSQLEEGVLKSIAHNEHKFMDGGASLESLPRVNDDRGAGDLKEQFVNARSHAGPATGGNDDGGIHCGKSGRGRPKGEHEKRRGQWSAP
jgi:hypothetical protein